MGVAMRVPLSMIVSLCLLSAVLVAVLVIMPLLGLVFVLMPAVIVCHATHVTSDARPPA